MDDKNRQNKLSSKTGAMRSFDESSTSPSEPTPPPTLPEMEMDAGVTGMASPVAHEGDDAAKHADDDPKRSKTKH